MKKFLAMILTVSICISFVACSKTENDTNKNTSTTPTTSSTVVYSEVYNMLITPDDYKGKLIKMRGNFNQYYDEESKKTYNAVIIPDATACCQQGLEFQLADKSSPNFEQGTEITVEGSFNTYSDGKFIYCYLENAQIVDN